VSLGGDALADFAVAAPTQHIKILFPAAGQAAPTLPEPRPDGPAWPEGQPRPVMRTYTPRRWDPEAGLLDVELVLHGDGPASEWAARAQVGDQLAVAGPGGRFSLPLDAERYVVAGDESALPAVATLLEALPAASEIDVYLEVAGADDHVELPAPGPGTRITWLTRRTPDGWGVELDAAVAGAEISADTKVWVACEAAAVRRIRRRLIERGHSLDALITRGYWRLGEQNHPDHDYGEDG
jgi:NADPH-dependent ferric siderophore reductase